MDRYVYVGYLLYKRMIVDYFIYMIIVRVKLLGESQSLVFVTINIAGVGFRSKLLDFTSVTNKRRKYCKNV